MQLLRFLSAALLCLAAITSSLPAWSQPGFPDKALTLVVPFPAGGSVDAIARAITTALAKELGQPVLIENLGGGSGSIGAAKVARAKADGYTLLLGTLNDVVLAPLVNRAVPYRTEDFSAVGKVGESSFILVGRQGLPARSIDELVELARKNPGKLSYATSGIGSAQHVLMETIQETAGISLLHVPYRGGTALVTDLLGGQVDLALVAPATFPDHIASGRVQSYGVTWRKRDELLKNVPTVNEGKYLKDINLGSWIGVFGPANLPPEAQRRLAAAVRTMLSDPDVVAHLKRIGLAPATAAEQASFAAAVTQTRAQLQATVAKMNLSEGAK